MRGASERVSTAAILFNTRIEGLPSRWRSSSVMIREIQAVGCANQGGSRSDRAQRSADFLRESTLNSKSAGQAGGVRRSVRTKSVQVANHFDHRQDGITALIRHRP